ncbi:MAG: protease, partial [Limisphaerales bacterium]
MLSPSIRAGLRLRWGLWITIAIPLAMTSGPAVVPAGSQEIRGYHRFPTLHGDNVVFTSEGDLWRVAAAGGVAQRLTTHPGTEAHASFSSDGSTIAFSAEYEGPREVYTMPLAGGLPTRRTFYGASSDPVGWTPDSRILARTTQLSGLPNAQLVEIDTGTGNVRQVPLAQASDGSYSQDGPTLFFTRLPWQGSSTKRYLGGTAQNLWRYSPRNPEAAPLTPDFKGTSKNPMVWRDRVYFLSDRDGIMNLWSIRTDGSDPRQHTRHHDFDVMGASLHKGRIAYQLGADLRLHDIESGDDRMIPIALASDFDQLRERWIQKPLDYLTAVQISPTGDRLVLTARGQVFVAPVEQGRFVEVPRQTGVRYRNAQFLPDGRSLLALSDESGELEFWRLAADGLTPPVQLTTNGTVFRFPPLPSPDGAWIAFSDKDLKLWIHHLERRETRLVKESPIAPLLDMAWSWDSQWLAFTDPATNGYGRISIYQPATSNLNTVTSDRVNSFSPAWSPDGSWLYFLSDREIRSMVNSPWGALQPDPFFTETTRIYQLALTPGLRSPFAPKDELIPESSDNRGASSSTNAAQPQPPALVPVPPPATNSPTSHYTGAP